MHKLPFILFLFPLLQSHTASNFPVEIKLIVLNSEKIQLQVEVKNMSPTSVKVLKRKIQDFKRNKTSYSGNYIIEIEKWEGNDYHLLEQVVEFIPPAHDADKEYTLFQKEKTIRDTLLIHWRPFTNGSAQKIFPGQYRIRISFNPTEWSSEQIHNSNWLEFVLD